METQEPGPEQQPQLKPNNRMRGGLGTLAAAAVVAITKLKFVAIGLKFFAGSWTFILSLVAYVLVFGWRFGVVILLSIAIHELGHYFAYRGYGLPARLPVFIPFLGAYTAGAIAPELEQDAYIALAGPVTGLALAGVCYGIGATLNDPFWYACANFSAFLNLINMIPILPFDGGRVIGAVWTPLWIAGAIIFVVVAWYIHVPLFFVLLLAAMGLPAMISAFRGIVDPRAAAMTNDARFRVGIWYVATVLGLILILGKAQAGAPPNGAL
jgi:Zn-dependent protease